MQKLYSACRKNPEVRSVELELAKMTFHDVLFANVSFFGRLQMGKNLKVRNVT